ncbi:MAG: alpha/beta hydrolase family protein [Gemmobacter sp.]
MRLLAALAVATTLVIAAPGASAAEETVRFTVEGQTVVGTLSLPAGEPAPVVLLLHGFTGTRDELPVAGTTEGVFARTARLLREAGLASLRIDFRDSGESDGAFEHTTFERQVADGRAALAFLAADPRVAGDRAAIIGWSQGGLVAAGVAGRGGMPAAVALWAAVSDPEPTFAGLLGKETIARGLTLAEGEPLAVTLPWGAQIALRKGFFEGLRSYDPLAEIAAYPGPLFVAQGSRDDLVPPVSAERFIAAHEGPEALWTAEMDHVFNVFTGPETLDAMVAATIAFLDPHLR